MLLGEWSYAWYLVHEIGIRCWLWTAGRPTGTLALLAVDLLLAAGTLAVAGALHRWVERPCERLLRGAPRHTGTPLPHPPVRVVRQRRRSVAGGQPSSEPSRFT